MATDSTIETKVPASSTPSLATSTSFKTFAITFAISGPILYFACLHWNLPLVNYHPAINRLDLGWTPAKSGEGPAMYWYGWTLTALLSTTIVSALATLLPERVTRGIPLYLVWALPLLMVPLLAYSLRAFWLHP